MVMQDPVTSAAAYYGADRAFGGGRDLSPGERKRNEIADVARELNQAGGLTPQEAAIVNNNYGGGGLLNLTPEQLLTRYRTLWESKNQGLLDWWNTAAGEQDPTYRYAYDTFRSIFGREPTETEYAQLLPIFGGAEGKQRGAAAISQMYEDWKKTPEYLRTQANEYSDELDPIFDTLLGRNFTQSELDYYGTALAGGQSQYEIEQMLRQLPEFQQAEDKKFRTGLADELQGYDMKFFDKAKEGIISRLAKNWGGAGTSSALDFALTNELGKIAENRGSYLANLSAQQYGGNKDAAREDYLGQMNRYYDQQNYEQRRRDADRDYYRSRADEDRDYTRQYNDYMNMQSRNRNRGSWIGSSLAGAGALAPLGPWGAAAGAGAGLWSYLDR
jgi:hypothetical protein